MTTINNQQTIQSMVTLAQQTTNERQTYLCLWITFTSITQQLAHQAGLRPSFGLRKNGTLRTKRVGELKVAEVYPPTEKAVLDRAMRALSPDIKNALIAHPSTRFFATRTPTWNGQPLKRDAYKQKLNGILDIGNTLDPRYPAWCPIEITAHQDYMQDSIPGKTQDMLARQIVDILAGLYRNLLHDGLEARGENTTEVIEAGKQLLHEVIIQCLPCRT